jgi:hypothetical protein
MVKLVILKTYLPDTTLKTEMHLSFACTFILLLVISAMCQVKFGHRQIFRHLKYTSLNLIRLIRQSPVFNGLLSMSVHQKTVKKSVKSLPEWAIHVSVGNWRELVPKP